MSRTPLSSIVDSPTPRTRRPKLRRPRKESVLRIFSRIVLVIGVALVGLACGQAEDPLVKIRKLQEEGRYLATIDELRTLADEDPSRAETQFLLGSALLFSGNGGLAIWPLRAAAKAPEYAIAARMLLARAMLESRTAPDAIRVIDEILELEPENIAALLLRIQAYQATGRNEDALVDIDRIREIDPDNVPVMVPRITALIATDQIDEAEKAIEEANEWLANTDEQVDEAFVAMLCIARGLFAHEKGDAEVAEAQYQECLAKFPVNPFVVQETANFYAMLGQPERATEILEKALDESGNGVFRMALAERMKAAGDTQEQEHWLREEAEQRPSTNSWFRLADFYVGRDEFDKALEAFDHALAVTPDPPESLLFAYADTLVQAKQFDKARAIVEGFEESALRDLIIGRILLGQGDPKGALASFEKGILLWPNNAAGRYLAGQAAERMGDFDRAITEYRESMRADPSRSPAALRLAELYSLRGKGNDALEAVRRHMQSNPGDIDGITVAIRVAYKARRFGVAQEGLERLANMPEHAATGVAEYATLVGESSPDGAVEAVEYIEKSELDLTDPANAAALRVLVDYLLELDRYADAAARVERALSAHPDVAVFHELHGRVLAAKGESPDGARAAFDRALELDPKNAGASIGLAELAAQAGDIDAALALYDRAAELDPDDSTAALAAAKLAQGAGRSADTQMRFEAILSEHPRSTDAALGLARILAEQGKFEASLDYARRAEWLRARDAEETLAWIEGLRARGGAGGDAPAAAN